jgi:superfamily II DNA or RNA helicase
MKEKDLKKSENMQVLLGTYSMSSEGMDIPELNTLIMASPKSDIEQSVGRILRKDHEDITPKIFDIVDDFSVFTNQGNKRRQFYKKNNYETYVCKIHDNCKYDVDEYNTMLDITVKDEFKRRNSKKDKEKEKGIFDNCLFE